MASRMYFWFNVSGSGLPTPAIAGQWESQVANFIRQPLRSATRATNASGIYTFTVSESDTAIHDQCCGQFISVPLLPQQISGQVHGIWMTRMAGSTYAIGTQLIIRVVSYDGTVVRGTLYGPLVYQTTTTTAGLSSRQFALTTEASRFLPGNPGAGTPDLTPLWVYHGDRLVVEIGARATNTVSTVRTADPQIQTQNTFTDGALQEDLTGSNFNTWIEFSQDIAFDAGYIPGTRRGWGVSIT